MNSTSRKDRNYKEKRSMLAFGHIALPLAAVIAVGLLFVGIKLFFLSPADREGVEIISEQAAVIESPEQTSAAQALTGETAPSTPAPQAPAASAQTSAPEPSAAVVLAGPVGSQPQTAAKPSGQKPAQPQKPTTPAKPQAGSTRPTTPKKDQNAQSPAPKPTTPPASGNFGVQIGAFSKRDGAETVAKEAAKHGYKPQISSIESSGKTFYRVRIAAGRTRDDAAKLAAELEKKGFPVAIISN